MAYNIARAGFNPNLLAAGIGEGMERSRINREQKVNDDFRRAQFLALTGATPESVLMGKKIADQIEGASGPMAARMAMEQKSTEPSISFQAPLQRQAMPEKPEMIETGNEIALPVGGKEVAPDVVSNIQKGIEQYTDLPAITKAQGRDRAISELSPEARGSLADYGRVSGMASNKYGAMGQKLDLEQQKLALRRDELSARDRYRQENLELSKMRQQAVSQPSMNSIIGYYRGLASAEQNALRDKDKLMLDIEKGGIGEEEAATLIDSSSSRIAGIRKEISDIKNQYPNIFKSKSAKPKDSLGLFDNAE